MVKIEMSLVERLAPEVAEGMIADVDVQNLCAETMLLFDINFPPSSVTVQFVLRFSTTRSRHNSNLDDCHMTIKECGVQISKYEEQHSLSIDLILDLRVILHPQTLLSR